MAVPTLLSWSGGKDAAYALHELQSGGSGGADDAGSDLAAVELLTTVNAARDRVTMHGVQRALVDRQAAALGLPVRYVEVPDDADNDAYERRMQRALAAAAGGGRLAAVGAGHRDAVAGVSRRRIRCHRGLRRRRRE